ncbi:MAG: uracil-DNA glycosylase [Deltaproteobacteria bacterium]|nr:uracil-DNA glycosylase [Deltaproteobacteria bacterium]
MPMPDRPAPPLATDRRPSLEATLRFALSSGAWIVAGAPARSPEVALPEPTQGAAAEALLRAIREDLGDCRRCRLWEKRARLVFGVGDPGARLLFVGEGPGAEEDRRGEPFVGRAGQLLDRMIGALGLERRQVYIANVVKCRPPSNREPAEDEASTCLPFLWRQIEAVRPRVVCALGAHAARSLLGAEGPLGALRGRVHVARGWTVLATYHPAYLLRNPSGKRQAWEDLKKVKALLEGEA